MKTRKKNKLHKINKKKRTRKRIFGKKHFTSGDGMITSIWGPSLWHYLHTVSFNYPIHPTVDDKKHYRNFILNLKYHLPCKYCRNNLKNNFKKLPLKMRDMKNRHTFSKYIYNLHELVNRMLGKKSGLTYCDIRERYEHFRSRCTNEKEREKEKKKEKGCVEPMYGKKAKGVIKIIPKDVKCKSITIHSSCLKKTVS